MTGIVEDLQQRVLKDHTSFLDQFANRRYSTGEQPQTAFLNVLADEMSKKLPSHRMIISVRFKRVVAQSLIKPEQLLEIPHENVRKVICGPEWWDQRCDSERCFEGRHLEGLEVDAAITHNSDFCLIEYQHSRKRICYDFMKMYWMRQFLNKPFESLFVTQVTTKEDEGSNTFKSFNQNMDHITPILNRLLQKWSMLEIVDLSGSSQKRHFHWRP
jgi:hypothetical protein